MSHKYPPTPPSTRRSEYQPVIEKEFIDKGVRYYTMVDGRLWDANKYDEMFRPEKLKVLSKHWPLGTDKDGIGSLMPLAKMRGRLRK